MKIHSIVTTESEKSLTNVEALIALRKEQQRRWRKSSLSAVRVSPISAPSDPVSPTAAPSDPNVKTDDEAATSLSDTDLKIFALEQQISSKVMMHLSGSLRTEFLKYANPHVGGTIQFGWIAVKRAANQHRSVIEGRLEDAYDAITHRPGESLLSYIRNFEAIADKFCAAGIPKRSSELAGKFLRRLHPKYNYLEAIITSQQCDQDFDFAVHIATEHAFKIGSVAIVESSVPTPPSSKSSVPPPSAPSPSSGPRSKVPVAIPCAHCFGKFHVTADCQHCYKCGYYGHIAKSCGEPWTAKAIAHQKAKSSSISSTSSTSTSSRPRPAPNSDALRKLDDSTPVVSALRQLNSSMSDEELIKHMRRVLVLRESGFEINKDDQFELYSSATSSALPSIRSFSNIFQLPTQTRLDFQDFQPDSTRFLSSSYST